MSRKPGRLKGSALVCGPRMQELMLRGGALKDVDAVVMVHPSAVNDVAPPFMAVAKVRVRYSGRASYVVGAPRAPSTPWTPR
ncbi:hypothetical protein V5799_008889 [Amblyomma americanum]|uniref:Uncharacterized protein n=1 Tax=Amblyomma americanum TaxID=6943 RepID=A0AAQ4FCN6_AMBAM